MSSDAASQSESIEIDEVDKVTLMWRRLTEGYKFEDGFSYDTLTEQFAIDDEDVAQAVCSEAFSYVMDDGRTLDVRTQSEFQTLHEITPSEGTAEAHAEDEAPTALLRDSHPQSPASAVYHIDDGEGHPLCNCASDAQYTPVPLAEAKASTARQCGNCTIARQGEQNTRPCPHCDAQIGMSAWPQHVRTCTTDPTRLEAER